MELHLFCKDCREFVKKCAVPDVLEVSELTFCPALFVVFLEASIVRTVQLDGVSGLKNSNRQYPEVPEHRYLGTRTSDASSLLLSYYHFW